MSPGLKTVFIIFFMCITALVINERAWGRGPNFSLGLGANYSIVTQLDSSITSFDDSTGIGTGFGPAAIASIGFPIYPTLDIEVGGLFLIRNYNHDVLNLGDVSSKHLLIPISIRSWPNPGFYFGAGVYGGFGIGDIETKSGTSSVSFSESPRRAFEYGVNGFIGGDFALSPSTAGFFEARMLLSQDAGGVVDFTSHHIDFMALIGLRFGGIPKAGSWKKEEREEEEEEETEEEEESEEDQNDEDEKKKDTYLDESV